MTAGEISSNLNRKLPLRQVDPAAKAVVGGSLPYKSTAALQNATPQEAGA